MSKTAETTMENNGIGEESLCLEPRIYADFRSRILPGVGKTVNSICENLRASRILY